MGRCLCTRFPGIIGRNVPRGRQLKRLGSLRAAVDANFARAIRVGMCAVRPTERPGLLSHSVQQMVRRISGPKRTVDEAYRLPVVGDDVRHNRYGDDRADQSLV